MKLRSSLAVISVVLLAAAGTSRAQYVEDSIDVGGGWVGSLVYSAEQDEVWGSSWGANSVFAVDCDSNKVVATLALRRAGDLAYDSVNGKLYCAYYGPGEESLAVIGSAAHQIIKKLEMPGSTTPVCDAISNRVYVSCQSTNSVAVVDCAADSLLTYISVGACPMKMYINTLRRKLYVLNYDDGTVSIINMVTNQVIKTVDVGGTPNAGYYCRRVDKFYTRGESRQSVVISGLSDTAVARIDLPGNVHVMSATGNEDAGLVYLGTLGGGDDYVATVSAQNDSVLVTTVIGAEPWGLAYYAPSGLLYCASAMTDEVRVLAGDGASVVTTLTVGDCPFVFATAPHHNRLYVGHSNTRYVYVLRDTSAGIAEPRSPRPGFSGVSVTPNPFSQRVALAWSAPARGNDVACVYAPDGSLIREAEVPVGASRWVWDGRDNRGSPVPPGVYVLAAPGGVRAKAIKIR